MAMIKVYAVAALAWRVMFFLALVLALVGMFSYSGALLAVLLLGFGWGVPGVSLSPATGSQPIVSANRQAASGNDRSDLLVPGGPRSRAAGSTRAPYSRRRSSNTRR